jgi:hypothetical protein
LRYDAVAVAHAMIRIVGKYLKNVRKPLRYLFPNVDYSSSQFWVSLLEPPEE